MLAIILLGWILHTLSAPAIIWLVYGVWAFLVFILNVIQFVKWVMKVT